MAERIGIVLYLANRSGGSRICSRSRWSAIVSEGRICADVSVVSSALIIHAGGLLRVLLCKLGYLRQLKTGELVAHLLCPLCSQCCGREIRRVSNRLRVANRGGHISPGNRPALLQHRASVGHHRCPDATIAHQRLRTEFGSTNFPWFWRGKRRCFPDVDQLQLDRILPKIDLGFDAIEQISSANVILSRIDVLLVERICPFKIRLRAVPFVILVCELVSISKLLFALLVEVFRPVRSL
ncbi:MAG: hypothetical protein ABJP70_01320 [Erythrobacter sp.]